jgi:hypothetical protein
MSLGAVFVALAAWRVRKHVRKLAVAATLAVLFLHIAMKAPVWHLIARIDLGGGGWHRARLMDRAIEHLGEWWIAGTDYTRHWMPSGISWSQNHTDITSHYLNLGVLGGLPLLFTFLIILRLTFKGLSIAFRASLSLEQEIQWQIWALGSFFFAHLISMFSVAYYDQSNSLFYCLVGLVISASRSLSTVENGSFEDASLEYTSPTSNKESINLYILDPVNCLKEPI